MSEKPPVPATQTASGGRFIIQIIGNDNTVGAEAEVITLTLKRSLSAHHGLVRATLESALTCLEDRLAEDTTKIHTELNVAATVATDRHREHTGLLASILAHIGTQSWYTRLLDRIFQNSISLSVVYTALTLGFAWAYGTVLHQMEVNGAYLKMPEADAPAAEVAHEAFWAVLLICGPVAIGCLGGLAGLFLRLIWQTLLQVDEIVAAWATELHLRRRFTLLGLVAALGLSAMVGCFLWARPYLGWACLIWLLSCMGTAIGAVRLFPAPRAAGECPGAKARAENTDDAEQ